MMKTIFLSLMATIFCITVATSQSCLLKEFKQERVNEKGESKEVLEYQLFYAPDGKLKEIKIEDNSTTDGSTLHLLKFERVELGRKITWFWDGEYDTHFILTNDGLLEFNGDNENDTNVENADTYPLTFENGKLTFDEDGNTTYNWKEEVINQSIRQGRKFKNTTVFTYTDVANPLHGLFELGVIEISVGNFVPLIYTLPAKLLATEDITREKEGVKQEYNGADKFSHTLNKSGCPEQFVVDKGNDKVIYTFAY